MPITSPMNSVLRRAVRPAALVLGSAALVFGAMAPAAAAPVAASPTTAARANLAAAASPTTTAARGPVATSTSTAILAAKKSGKKPARVKKPKLVKNGSRHDNVRISWPWVSGAARYVVQASTKKSFKKKGRVTAKRSNPRSRPAGGRVELTVPGLKNATTYRVRVRAIAANGKKGTWSKVRKAATKVHIPERITKMTATPGPKPGQVTFRWKHKKRYTKFFTLDLASTTFHPKGKNLPKKGRNHLRIKIPANKKKFVLSAKRAAKAGARLGSGNHLYYRFAAVNKGKGGKKTRLLPNLRGVQPAGRSVASASSSVDARVGTFNLSSKKKDGNRDWDARVGLIARTIVSNKLGVVALQELSPGAKGDRPTDQLVRELRKAGGTFEMVRTSPYFEAGTKNVGSQGARIIYDSSRYDLDWNCWNDTGNREYSDSCAIEMPVGPGEKHGRMAGFALLRDKSTGAQFWFVSLHLTPDGGKARDALRKNQVEHVVAEIEKMNPGNLPIVLAGDLNSWQNRLVDNAPHDFLLGRGFVDTFSAAKKTNPQYSTYNKFDTRVKKYGQGFGVRLDYVLVKNGAGVLSWTNVMKPVDSSRASDHNLVVADIRLPVGR